MRKSGCIFGFVLLCLCFASVAEAQVFASRKDSLKALRDTMNVYYYNPKILCEDGEFVKEKTDTSLHELHNYNPVTRQFGMMLTDNLGRPYQPAFYETDTLRGFSTGRNQMGYYHYRGGEQPFYRTKRAYTLLGYTLGTAGQKKENRTGEQTMRVLHTQPISPYVQAGIDFYRITSVGFYQRQWASHSNIRAFLSYQAPKENYGLAAEFIFNNSRVQENGGLTDNVNFRESEITNLIDGNEVVSKLNRKFGYPVNLSEAENQHQTYALWIKQFYRFGVKSYQPDTAKPAVKLPLFQIDNTFRIFTDRTRFIDSSANGFFNNYFFDSSGTFHRVYHRQTDMDLEFTFFPYRKKGLSNKISGGVNAALFDVLQAGEKYTGYNVSVFSKLHFYIDSLRYVKAFAEYNFLGYNQNDLYIKAHIFAGFNNRKKHMFMALEPGVIFRLREPGYLWQRTFSNHFIWDNAFKKTRTLGVYADVLFPTQNLKISGRFFNIGNALYYDSLAIAQQATQEVVLFQASARYDLAFSKKRFHFVNHILFQTVNSDVLRVAPFHIRSSFYYENYLFKKALFLQAGFDIFYGLAYEGYGYNPALASYFLQAQNARIGNYPYLDVYVSARIKRFKLFIHGGHLNQGFPKPSYFTTARYPMQDRSIRLGISWGLFN
ncbi:MAG: putative porin [Flavobacteriales bacterium]|nr:putative porin [Flavobacteriales bacterium]